MKTKERRRLHRHALLFNLEAHSRDNGAPIGRVGDLHARGLALLTSTAYSAPAVGAELAIVLMTPEADEEPARLLELDLVVRWSRPEANPELQRVGCEILAPSRSTVTAIAYLIERFDFAR